MNDKKIVITKEVFDAYNEVKKIPPLRDDPALRYGSFQPSYNWKILFKFYNENAGQKSLHMSCQPCYIKVFKFVKALIILAENGKETH